jgi:hypothetical protein
MTRWDILCPILPLPPPNCEMALSKQVLQVLSDLKISFVNTGNKHDVIFTQYNYYIERKGKMETEKDGRTKVKSNVQRQI